MMTELRGLQAESSLSRASLSRSDSSGEPWISRAPTMARTLNLQELLLPSWKQGIIQNVIMFNTYVQRCELDTENLQGEIAEMQKSWDAWYMKSVRANE